MEKIYCDFSEILGHCFAMTNSVLKYWSITLNDKEILAMQTIHSEEPLESVIVKGNGNIMVEISFVGQLNDQQLYNIKSIIEKQCNVIQLYLKRLFKTPMAYQPPRRMKMDIAFNSK